MIADIPYRGQIISHDGQVDENFLLFCDLVASIINDGRVPVSTVADLPPADIPGRVRFVSDESGGTTLAFDDGSAWRRAQDRAIVS